MGSAEAQRVGSRRLTPGPAMHPIADGARVGRRAQCPRSPRETVLSFKSLRKMVMEKHFCAANGERAVGSSRSTENTFPWSHQLGNEDAVKACALHSTTKTS